MASVRVCQELFPKTNGFLMDENLKVNLDILIKNIVKDWDFTIIISGGGEVRVGKSVLAMQIACYIYYMMWRIHKKKTLFNLENTFAFNGFDLIKKGNYLGKKYPYSPFVYDEAGADLQGRKIMHSTTQAVLDYFRECGQYNLFNILVIPEYFDLPKGIALSRSIFLIDVYYTGEFVRGYYHFFSRRQKKKLYLRGKKELNYFAAAHDFRGKFSNFYTIDEKQYRKLKQKALSERMKVSFQEFKLKSLLRAAFLYIKEQARLSHTEIAERISKLSEFKISYKYVERLLKIKKDKFTKQYEEEHQESADTDDGQ